jgi:serine/threonine protein phosphatase PrpC
MSNTTPCPACGAASPDPQWCAQCGANLTQRQQVQWLEVGARVCFCDLTPEVTAPLHDGASQSFDAILTRIDPDAAPPPEAIEAATQSAPDSAAPQTLPSPVSIVDPFELIGGTPPEAIEAAAATSDSPIEDLPLPLASTSEPPSPSPQHSPAPGLWVEVTALSAAYSKRKLWLAESLIHRLPYVIEERQGLSRLAPPDADDTERALCARYLFPILATQSEDGRTLSLRARPQGIHLLHWREAAFPPPTPEQIYAVFSKLLQAVEDIHRSGCLHLHLSPEHVWAHDDSGQVRFSELDRFERLPLRRDQVRARLGYSAPELFGHGRQNIDQRSDVYSLGALLYLLISGRRPPVSADTGFSPAIPPRDYRPDFPVGWSDIILVAMAPQPAHRFGSVSELADALRAGMDLIRLRATYRAPVHLDAAVERHIGFGKQKRSPVNQDQVFLGQDTQRDRLLVVVADGVSTATYGSGDLASGFIAKHAEAMWNQLEFSATDPDPRALIEEIIRRANCDVSDYVNQHHGPLDAPPSEVMGSTALIAYITQGQMLLGSLGDSRCYLIRDDVMECITRDHNLFTLSLIEGLNLEHALSMPHGDALARCLGTFDVDSHGVLIPHDPPLDLYTLRLLPSDRILLCTDGLFDYAGSSYEESEEHIRQRVLTEEHPGIACLELILLANRGGGGDNIGLALIHVSEP